jgi:hypothetical protein
MCELRQEDLEDSIRDAEDLLITAAEIWRSKHKDVPDLNLVRGVLEELKISNVENLIKSRWKDFEDHITEIINERPSFIESLCIDLSLGIGHFLKDSTYTSVKRARLVLRFIGVDDFSRLLTPSGQVLLMEVRKEYSEQTSEMLLRHMPKN